ncbi:MAG: carbon-nitrogen hydrolase family protein [Nitrososphaerota archaeon]|nr:carbon-nitrogen hydrolase family protein [Nitrososphaerota archaeon]MDG6941482.1 carbon-nitrogen hydrolase family protein [Nitrososphaerota archaeon]
MRLNTGPQGRTGDHVIKVTVCEMPDERSAFGLWWERLGAHAKHEGSDLALLPEMPFSGWLFADPKFGRAAWDDSVEAHRRWIERIPELGVAIVAGSRPVEVRGRRFNEGFVQTADGMTGEHRKRNLPDQPGFYEASWYVRGGKRFSVFEVHGWKIGFLICSDLWSVWNARAYGKRGADAILVPRATGLGVDKWLAGGRTAAVVSGAYCLSSNRSGGVGDARFGGMGWAVDPDGEVLGITTPDEPFATVELDMRKARKAKKTYPRDAFGED